MHEFRYTFIRERHFFGGCRGIACPPRHERGRTTNRPDRGTGCRTMRHGRPACTGRFFAKKREKGTFQNRQVYSHPRRSTGMGSLSSRSHAAFLLLVIFLLVPPAAGWTLSSFSSTPPAGAGLPPGTAVSATYTLHFDSWMTGSTFENDNTLSMSTDLESPQWTAVKREEMDNQEPIVETIPVRQSSIVKLDGWTLSYSSKRFDLIVTLAGTTPERGQTGTIAIVKLQEFTPDAKPVSGTLIKKEMQVVIPTPVPTLTTPEPTPEPTPVAYIEITPEPTGTTAPRSPSGRATYAPGPDPALIAGVLAGLVLLGRR